jgi:hypothetical protein
MAATGASKPLLSQATGAPACCRLCSMPRAAETGVARMMRSCPANAWASGVSPPCSMSASGKAMPGR